MKSEGLGYLIGLTSPQ